MSMSLNNRMKVMKNINAYKINKVNNRKYILKDENIYIFKNKKDAVKFGYYLNRGETEHKLTIDFNKEDNSTLVFLTDEILNLQITIAGWFGEDNNFIGSLENYMYYSEDNYNDWLESLKKDFNINTINTELKTIEMHIKTYIEWSELLEDFLVIDIGTIEEIEDMYDDYFHLKLGA
jgi:hypothetical protein